MASASSPAARASPLALAREREEQKKLWRVVDRTFTSLELGRRKWDKLSEQGKLALQRLVNSRSKLGYAHRPSCIVSCTSSSGTNVVAMATCLLCAEGAPQPASSFAYLRGDVMEAAGVELPEPGRWATRRVMRWRSARS